MNETTHKHSQSHDRSVASILSELKDEFKEFVNTRVRMMRAEIEETKRAMKAAVPWALAGFAFGGVGFLMFTLALVVLVASAFPGSPYAWFYGFLIVGAIWMAVAGICAVFAFNPIRNGRFPKRTVEVLKADRAWLQGEARSHL